MIATKFKQGYLTLKYYEECPTNYREYLKELIKDGVDREALREYVCLMNNTELLYNNESDKLILDDAGWEECLLQREELDNEEEDVDERVSKYVRKRVDALQAPGKILLGENEFIQAKDLEEWVMANKKKPFKREDGMTVNTRSLTYLRLECGTGTGKSVSTMSMTGMNVLMFRGENLLCQNGYEEAKRIRTGEFAKKVFVITGETTKEEELMAKKAFAEEVGVLIITNFKRGDLMKMASKAECVIVLDENHKFGVEVFRRGDFEDLFKRVKRLSIKGGRTVLSVSATPLFKDVFVYDDVRVYYKKEAMRKELRYVQDGVGERVFDEKKDKEVYGKSGGFRGLFKEGCRNDDGKVRILFLNDKVKLVALRDDLVKNYGVGMEEITIVDADRMRGDLDLKRKVKEGKMGTRIILATSLLKEGTSLKEFKSDEELMVEDMEFGVGGKEVEIYIEKGTQDLDALTIIQASARVRDAKLVKIFIQERSKKELTRLEKEAMLRVLEMNTLLEKEAVVTLTKNIAEWSCYHNMESLFTTIVKDFGVFSTIRDDDEMEVKEVMENSVIVDYCPVFLLNNWYMAELLLERYSEYFFETKLRKIGQILMGGGVIVGKEDLTKKEEDAFGEVEKERLRVKAVGEVEADLEKSAYVLPKETKDKGSDYAKMVNMLWEAKKHLDAGKSDELFFKELLSVAKKDGEKGIQRVIMEVVSGEFVQDIVKNVGMWEKVFSPELRSIIPDVTTNLGGAKAVSDFLSKIEKDCGNNLRGVGKFWDLKIGERYTKERIREITGMKSMKVKNYLETVYEISEYRERAGEERGERGYLIKGFRESGTGYVAKDKVREAIRKTRNVWGAVKSF